MVAPLIWIGGLLAGGYVLSQASDAAESTAKLAKWGAAGGAVYVSYLALKSSGALK